MRVKVKEFLAKPNEDITSLVNAFIKDRRVLDIKYDAESGNTGTIKGRSILVIYDDSASSLAEQGKQGRKLLTDAGMRLKSLDFQNESKSEGKSGREGSGRDALPAPQDVALKRLITSKDKQLLLQQNAPSALKELANWKGKVLVQDYPTVGDITPSTAEIHIYDIAKVLQELKQFKSFIAGNLKNKDKLNEFLETHKIVSTILANPEKIEDIDIKLDELDLAIKEVTECNYLCSKIIFLQVNALSHDANSIFMGAIYPFSFDGFDWIFEWVKAEKGGSGTDTASAIISPTLFSLLVKAKQELNY